MNSSELVDSIFIEFFNKKPMLTIGDLERKVEALGKPPKLNNILISAFIERVKQENSPFGWTKDTKGKLTYYYYLKGG